MPPFKTVDQAQSLRIQTQKKRPQCRTIAITSGKGGVGKSNLTVNLSIALSQLGKRVLILDADIGMANVDLIFGLTPKYTLQHVFAGKQSIADVIVEGYKGVYIIPGVSGTMNLVNLSPLQRQQFFKELHHIESELLIDYILIDTGAGLSEHIMNFVLAADEMFCISTPEPTALMDAYSMIKASVKRNDQVKIKLIANMVKSKKEADYVFNTLSIISKKFLNYEFHLVGYVLKDDLVPQCVKNQKPFMIKYPYKPAAICVKSIANHIIQRQPVFSHISNIRQLLEKTLLFSKNK